MSNETKFEHLDHALSLIGNVFESISPEQCAIAFSGGKESIVLLHLVYEVLQTKYGYQPWPRCFMYCDKRESIMGMSLKKFAQRHLSTPGYTRFQLDMIESTSLREGLEDYTRMYPKIRTFFIGTRSSDPSGSKATGPLEKNTDGWPELTRVMPLFSWQYHQVWDYIDNHELSYPSAYKDGFTSLGLDDGARPNPKLRKSDGSYGHARELKEKEAERDSRII